MMMNRNILGREPAVLVGLLETALAVLLAFGLFDVSQKQLGAIVGLASAVLSFYVATATKDTLLGVALALGKSILSLAVAFGLDLTTEQTGVLIAFGTAVISAFQRTQTSPVQKLTLSGGWSASEDTARAHPELAALERI
jgi:hypothetical protein